MEGGNGLPPFLSKTYDMVDDAGTDAVVSWGAHGNSFVVWNPPQFARDLIPKYFKHNNFSSFVRQLNTYGFKKVDPDRWEFTNESFLRGKKNLLKGINRRKPYHSSNHASQSLVQSQNSLSEARVGKLGLEEEIQRLRRVKNVLMQELIRLRQHQQSSDHLLQTLGQRLNDMNQRQQQIMSFLAKAIQSPQFLAQIGQNNDNNSRHVAGVTKKRRLPNRDDVEIKSYASPEGQMIKFQSKKKETTKEILMSMLKMGTALEQETSDESPLDIASSEEHTTAPSESLDSGSSYSVSSQVMFGEVSPGPEVVQCFPSNAVHSSVPPAAAVVPPPPAMYNINPSTVMANILSAPDISDVDILPAIPEVMSPCQPDIAIPIFSPMQEVAPVVCGIPASACTVSDAITYCPAEISIPFVAMEAIAPELNVNEYVSPVLAADLDIPVPLEAETLVANTNIDILVDEGPNIQPGIKDPFWEQFVAPILVPEDTETLLVQAGSPPSPPVVGENGWYGAQNMEHLIEQMGLLTSES